MELRQLRYFVAVAEEGNISRAAQKIFLTQPALSRQIKALEEEIGELLLERRSQSIALTAAGEVLWLEARGLLAEADALVEKVRASKRGARLRVGYAPSLTAGLLATAIGRFTQSHPLARVELFDLSTTEMVDGIKNDSLDVMLTVQQACVKAGVEWIPLCDSAWKLAVNRRHPLAKKKRVTAAQIAAEPLLIYQRSEYPDYHDFISAWFRQQRQAPRITGEFDGSASLIAAIEAGLGVALVSDRSVTSAQVELLDLSDGLDALVIAAGWRSGRKLANPVQVFIEELKATAAI